MPGVWLIASTFFLAALFYRWWVIVALVLFLLCCWFLLRKNLWWGLKRISLPIFVGIVLGIYSSSVLPKDVKSIVPSKSQFTVEGLVRYVSIPDGKRILIHGKYIVVAGKRISFPYQIWIKYMGKKRLPERLVGEYVSVPVYFNGKNFFFYPADYSHRSHWVRFIFRPAYWMRKVFYHMLRPLGTQSRTIAQAVLIGIKNWNFYRLKEDFNSIGAGHILAISGLHLVILTALVFWIPKVFGLPELASDIIALLFVIVYMLMIPESASLFRAGVMFSLFLFSRIIRRNWSVYDLLGLTVFIIFFINPQEVFSIGFWMSGLAVLAIFLGLSLLPRHSLLDLWYISLVVSLVLGPIIIKFFGCYSVVSWVINPVMILLMTLFLILLVMYIVSFGWVGKPLLDLLANAMVFIPELLKDRALPICLPNLSWSVIYLYYLLLLLCVAVIGWYMSKKEFYEKWI